MKITLTKKSNGIHSYVEIVIDQTGMRDSNDLMFCSKIARVVEEYNDVEIEHA